MSLIDLAFLFFFGLYCLHRVSRWIATGEFGRSTNGTHTKQWGLRTRAADPIDFWGGTVMMLGLGLVCLLFSVLGLWHSLQI
tara:strand:- start:9233 stop:9478 length:246 start_codon:yes stop_codon:yes gene_type:complete